MKSITQRIPILLLFLFVISCNEDVSIKKQDSDLPTVKDGYLNFKDNTSYNQIVTLLRGMTQEQQNNWEKSLAGFTSMKTLYNQALIEEEYFLENGGKEVGQSPFVLANKKAFIVLDSDNLQPNLPPYQREDMLSNLVNKSGLVKICSSIFEYRNGSIKEIRDGDISKIEILDQISQSDKDMNISVINISIEYQSSKSGKSKKIAFSGNSSCTGYTQGGGQRVQGNIAIYNYTMVDIWGNTPYPGQVVYKTEVQTSATNQFKKLFGWGNKNTAMLQIIGNVTLSPYGTVAVNLNSGGAQTSNIFITLYSSGWVNTGYNPVLSIYGNLSFYGRDYSECSI